MLTYTMWGWTVVLISLVRVSHCEPVSEELSSLQPVLGEPPSSKRYVNDPGNRLLMEKLDLRPPHYQQQAQPSGTRRSHYKPQPSDHIMAPRTPSFYPPLQDSSTLYSKKQLKPKRSPYYGRQRLFHQPEGQNVLHQPGQQQALHKSKGLVKKRSHASPVESFESFQLQSQYPSASQDLQDSTSSSSSSEMSYPEGQLSPINIYFLSMQPPYPFSIIPTTFSYSPYQQPLIVPVKFVTEEEYVSGSYKSAQKKKEPLQARLYPQSPLPKQKSALLSTSLKTTDPVSDEKMGPVEPSDVGKARAKPKMKIGPFTALWSAVNRYPVTNNTEASPVTDVSTIPSTEITTPISTKAVSTPAMSTTAMSTTAIPTTTMSTTEMPTTTMSTTLMSTMAVPTTEELKKGKSSLIDLEYEPDIETILIAEDQNTKTLYAIFPNDWKDEAICSSSCGQGKNASLCCLEISGNEKWCPKQPRLCAFELEKIEEKMDTCSSNANCSLGDRCCFDRCADTKVCKSGNSAPRRLQTSVQANLPSSISTPVKLQNASATTQEPEPDIEEPIIVEDVQGKKVYMIYPRNWDDTKECKKKCENEDGSISCCSRNSEKEKSCPKQPKVCVLNLEKKDEFDRCSKDANCPQDHRCCYDRCANDRICKAVEKH